MILDYVEQIQIYFPKARKVVLATSRKHSYDGITIFTEKLSKGLRDYFEVQERRTGNDAVVIKTRIDPLDIFTFFRCDIYVFHDAIAYTHLNFVKAALAFAMQSLYIRSASRIICVSNHAKKQLLQYHKGVCAGDVAVIRHDFGEIKFQEKDFLIWIGSMKKHKRLDRVLELAKAMPSVNIVLICKPTKNYFSQKNISFISGLPKNILFQLITSSLGVICTSDDEGYYLPFLEAVGLEKECFALKIPIFEELYAEQHLVNLYDDLERMREGILAHVERTRGFS